MQKCIYCNTEIESGLETCPSCGMPLIETHTLKPGTVIGGKYEVVKKLGEGGFGITYVVKNVIFNKNQAMKELFIKSTCGRASTSQTNTNHVYSSQNQDFEYYKEKFIKEMGTLLQINHPNIVRMYDLVMENNTVYGIMEYIEGSTLKQIIREKNKLKESEALEILNQIGRGLKEIHDVGLTHRDIKPDNIMIDDKGKYKIIDFGLVKEYQEASVTLSQVVSEGYSPQEQYRKKGKVTPATDIYSLGMTIYSSLTGDLSPDNPTDRIEEDTEYEFQKSISDLEISDSFKSVLRKMTRVKARERYQDFGYLFSELRVSSHSEKKITQNAKPTESVIEPAVSEPQPEKEPEKIIAPDYQETEEDVPEYYEDKTEDKTVHEESTAANQPEPFPDRFENNKKKSLMPISIIIALLAISGIIIGIHQSNLAKKERQRVIAERLKFVTDSIKIAEAKSQNYINSQTDKIEKAKNFVEDSKKAQEQTLADLNFVDIVFVQGGTFQMGGNESDEKPIHSVTVGDFYIGKTEVTQAQWKAVMGDNPSRFTGGNNPVEQVRWHEAVEFCKKLSQKEGVSYRLPTEAEWEYAARGGNASKGYEYSGSNNVGEVAEYDGNNDKSTKPVGGKEPNELGIYDMSGNIWEWCSDWYDSDYYKNSPSINPTGPSSGSDRVFRGGSWRYGATDCRVANRASADPDGFVNLGFRVVRLP